MTTPDVAVDGAAASVVGKELMGAKMVEKTYATNDLVIPTLAKRGALKSEANDCLVKVVVSDQHVKLSVGPRDWQWDRESEELIGSGTLVARPPLTSA